MLKAPPAESSFCEVHPTGVSLGCQNAVTLYVVTTEITRVWWDCPAESDPVSRSHLRLSEGSQSGSQAVLNSSKQSSGFNVQSYEFTEIFSYHTNPPPDQPSQDNTAWDGASPSLRGQGFTNKKMKVYCMEDVTGGDPRAQGALGDHIHVVGQDRPMRDLGTTALPGGDVYRWTGTWDHKIGKRPEFLDGLTPRWAEKYTLNYDWGDCCNASSPTNAKWRKR